MAAASDSSPTEIVPWGAAGAMMFADGAHFEEVAGVGAEQQARDDPAVRAGQEQGRRILTVSETLEGRPKTWPPATQEVGDSMKKLVHQRGPSASRSMVTVRMKRRTAPRHTMKGTRHRSARSLRMSP